MSKFINAPYELHYTREGYKLPLRILDDSNPLANEIVRDTMLMWPPRTNLAPGSLVSLKALPTKLQKGLACVDGLLPSVWKVRYTISMWGYMIMKEAQNPQFWNKHEDILMIDRLIDYVGATVPQQHWRQPLAYVHAMPHGLYPDSAMYVPEKHLRVIAAVTDGTAETLVPWEVVTDEANTHFLGYDVTHYRTGFDFDMAPDDYASGEPVGVFEHEEPTIHTLCILGYEEDLMAPKEPWDVVRQDQGRHGRTTWMGADSEDYDITRRYRSEHEW